MVERHRPNRSSLLGMGKFQDDLSALMLSGAPVLSRTGRAPCRNCRGRWSKRDSLALDFLAQFIADLGHVNQVEGVEGAQVLDAPAESAPVAD